ncbi:MAG: hypothetical protein ACSLFN_15735 [Candidatus Limnocylindrales bacterium]
MSSRGTVLAGLILILVGGLFLARELVPGVDLGRLWPIGSLILGLVLLAASIRPGRSAD